MTRSVIRRAALALPAVIAVATFVIAVVPGRNNTSVAEVATPSGYLATAPNRVFDSRNSAKLNAGQTLTISTGITGAAAVAVNMTLTNTEGYGFITAWSGAGAPPNASVINSDSAGQSIANFVVVPVQPNGTFSVFSFGRADFIVDVMGYYPAAAAPIPPGANAVITGYGPGSTITSVVGTVTNGTGATLDLRVDLRCPNGDLETDYVYDIPAGATRGWEVLCTGAFNTGATVSVVEV